MRHVLHPTDFSPASEEALDRAVGLAADQGATLTVFHADRAQRDDARLRDKREEISRRAETLLTGRRPRTGFEISFRSAEHSTPMDGIVAEAQRLPAEMIVMATHGGGIVNQSLAESVVRRASCSVLTCRRNGRGRWPLEPGRILVAVDFSDSSRNALEMAKRVAGPDCPITLVHVVEVPRHPTPYQGRIVTPFGADAGLEDRVTEHMRQWAGPGIDDVLAVQGQVRIVLDELARKLDAALIVVGPHGLRDEPEYAVGSTAERLTRSSRTPVMTVRA